MIMGTRYVHLQYALDGLRRTGVPLIEFNGTELMPSFTNDDIGIYVLIPKIALWLGISIDTAISLFFNGILLFSLALGFIGIYFLYKTWLPRMVAVIGSSLLIRVAYGVVDVYIVAAAIVVMIIPLFLHIEHSKKTNNGLSLLFFLFAGLMAGIGHYIRVYSSVGLLLFMGLTLIFNGTNWHKKLITLSALFCGLMLSHGYFSYVYNNHMRYTRDHLPHYQVGLKQHVFWHTVYLGFGFLQHLNDEHIIYDDSFAEQKVKSIAPNLTMTSINDSYEAVLKNEVYKLIKYKLNFVLFTLFAKLGILFLFLIRYANFGLIAAFFYRKPLLTDFIWFIALAFNSLTPLITMPFTQYSLGFIAMATWWAIVSINYALECGVLRDTYYIKMNEKIGKVLLSKF